MKKLSISSATEKPRKPRHDFPLFPHATKRWAKKIRGKMWYFGSWADGPDAALDRYLKERDAIHAGQNPREEKPEGYTLAQLCNEFLNKKKADMETGKMKARHFADLHKVCERLIEVFGAGKLAESIGPGDFERLEYSYPKTWKLRRRRREIGGTRSVFNYAAKLEKIPKTRFGLFSQPSKEDLDAERVRNEKRHGGREFTAKQVRAILDAAPFPLKAMVYLGINIGYGNTDCAELTAAYLDLDRGIAKFPRPKTNVKRRAILWPETIAAVRKAIAQRPAPMDPQDADRVFLTKTGLPWVRSELGQDENGNVKMKIDDGLCKVFSRLLRDLGINRRGLSFYSLRHCCETFGGIDQIAIDLVMGHKTAGMGTNYRGPGSITDERLRTVSESIRNWLFGEEEQPTLKLTNVS